MAVCHVSEVKSCNIDNRWPKLLEWTAKSSPCPPTGTSLMWPRKEWIAGPHLQRTWSGSLLRASLQTDAFSSMERFHAIIYCGAIPELNLSLEKLLCVGGTLIAPVEVAEGSQQFQLLCRRSATNTENVKITNLLFLFEDVPWVTFVNSRHG